MFNLFSGLYMCMCKTLSPSGGLPFTSYVKTSSSKAVDNRNSPLESCLRQLRSFVVRDVRLIKPATFLSTRTAAAGSKLRRYGWRMMASAVLV